MRRAITITALSLTLCGVAGAEDGALNDRATVTVIDNRSCARWLESAATKNAGDHWIAGFWTGLNVFSQRNRLVGDKVDPEGIIGEVEKVCREHPSMALVFAAKQVYDMMAEQHR